MTVIEVRSVTYFVLGVVTLQQYINPSREDCIMAEAALSGFNDKLYTLDVALDGNAMRGHFTPLVHKFLGETLEVRRVGVEVLRRRNQRCVIRYLVDADDPQHDHHFQWRVIGKVYKARRGEHVFSVMQQLWKKGFHREARDGIFIPEPLEFSSSLCMLFQEEVPGAPMKTLAKQSPSPGHFQQLARVIAKLHRCPYVPDEPFLVQNHLLRCHPRYPFLALACPELETRINYIVDTAKSIEDRLVREAKLTPIHGDFHLGQVHLENGNAWLIDFDALSYGDPAADLGNVLVFLRGKVKRNPDFAVYIQAFLEEYFSLMDTEIANRLLLYEGLTHLRRACKTLRLQEEGWRRRLTRMVDEGVRCIEEMGRNFGAVFDALLEPANDEELQEVDE